MELILKLAGNRVLLSGLLAWAAAQLLKTAVHAIVNRRLELPRLVGDGGMPSSHSATVSALAVTSALKYGLDSFQFGLTAILAFIVMHDAMGVRRETGKQAKVLNDIIEFFDSLGEDLTPEERLKELVGHTPVQVVAGAAIGIAVAFLLR